MSGMPPPVGGFSHLFPTLGLLGQVTLPWTTAEGVLLTVTRVTGFTTTTGLPATPLTVVTVVVVRVDGPPASRTGDGGSEAPGLFRDLVLGPGEQPERRQFLAQLPRDAGLVDAGLAGDFADRALPRHERNQNALSAPLHEHPGGFRVGHRQPVLEKRTGPFSLV